MTWKSQREAIIAGLILSLIGTMTPGIAEDKSPEDSKAPASAQNESAPSTETKPADAGSQKETKPADSGDASKTGGDEKSDNSADAGKSAPPAGDAEKSKDEKKDDSKKAEPGESDKKSPVEVKELKTGEKKASGKLSPTAKKIVPGKSKKPAVPPKKTLAQILGPLPAKRVSMDFRGMDIDNVLLLYSSWAGVTIVKDPGLTGPINLIQTKEVSLLDSFKILQAILNLKGFEFSREGPILRVTPKQAAPPAGGAPPPGPANPAPPASEEETVTNIYPLKNASAQTVARIINDTFGGGSPQPGQPGQPPQQPQPAQPAQPGAKKKKSEQKVKATADYDTNKVIVVGDKDLMDDVKTVIDALDLKTDIPLIRRSWEIKYADVNDVATQVAALLASISGTGRNSPFQDVPFERRILGGGGGGYNPYGNQNSGPQTQAGGRVISDPRTNTLTVFATDDQLDKIDELIKSLDKKVEYASTTFIMPLKHLEASEAAYVLTQLFQDNNNNNPFGFFFFGSGGNSSNNQVRQRRRLGDAQSARPQRSSQNNNSFGFSSYNASPNSSSDPNATAAAAASSASASSAQSPDSQETPYSAADDTSDGKAFPIPKSVTIDGEQLAQWWAQQDNSPKTGRDEEGRIRPLVDLKGKITLVPDLNGNALIVNTNPSNLAALKEVLKMIDKQPAQVLIEGIIVEASLDTENQIGMSLNWSESPAFGNSGTAQQTTATLPLGTATTSGLNFKVLGNNFSSILQAVRTDRRFNILSTPRIFTQNNVQAAVTIGQSVPLLNASNSFGSTSSQIVYKDVGVTLDVTPHLTGDGYVSIEVGQDADEISGYTTLANNSVPIINKRSVETTVTAKDGQTVVLGGLIRNSLQNNQTKIPILSDLPLIGSLFRSKDRTRSKTELMIFLRAQIVYTDNDVDDVTNRQSSESGIDPKSENGKHLNLNLPKKGSSDSSKDEMNKAPLSSPTEGPQ